MATLTKTEREFVLSLMQHEAVHKLFDDLEQSRLNEAVSCKATETEKINAALGEVRAVRSFRKSLEIIAAEERAKAAG